jgi:hypothetical protein
MPHLQHWNTHTNQYKLQLDGVAIRTPELGCSGVNPSNFLRHGMYCKKTMQVRQAARRSGMLHHLQGASSCRGYIYMAPFGIKVSLKYSTNTSVSQNTEVSNTLSCLDLVNTLVLETESILQNFIFLPY